MAGRTQIQIVAAQHEFARAGWIADVSEAFPPEAMKREIWRNYPVMEKVALVESLLDRGVLADGSRVSKQPGRCCVTGCEVPERVTTQEAAE